ncbi:MFS transporter [Winogradskyella maritima]|uniref:Endo-1,3-beta-glucanase btgC n=1 Tax=Winogradskyella maritima TaxID=1517766 RepID=A0ABV8ACQ4_9FLAO|nr:MFS transporter [Winogradskyella maritima]
MSTYKNKVPFGQKVAFGVGMLANQMFPAVLGIFMVVLVQDLGFPGWMWGVLFFAPRIFDSITDPIMGFISDNTKSRWGRRRQYVFLGALIMGISFIVMWQLYRENGVDYNFTYFLLWSFVFYLGLTIFSVPYVAMGYEMSDDFHERTNIMAVAQWIGQWAWVIAPWFWVIMYDQDMFPSADVATRTLAIWVGIICALFAMVPAIFLKSRSTLDEDYLPLTFRTIGGSLKEIVKGFVEAFSIKPFRKLCISTFFIFNAFNTIAAFSFFIVVYHLFGGNAGDAGIWPTLFGSLGALVTTFMVIPIVTKMSSKLGKKRAFMTAQGISLVGYIMLWFLFVPGKPYLFIYALPFFSFGIGSLFVLMMSMTADVIDLDELNTGKRREGIFGAIYWWMVKFGFAIAGLCSGLIMDFVGFTPDAPTQPEGAVDGLRMFFSGVPIIGTLIAMWVMKDYGVDEARAAEVRAQLESRKVTILDVESSGYNAGHLKNLVDNLKLTDYASEDLSSHSDSEISKLFKQTLHNGVYGLCFSPFLKDQTDSDTIYQKQIKRRMEIIAPHTKWVRSFSSTKGHELIPSISASNGANMMLGVWISDDKNRNELEIESAIQQAKNGNVEIVAVGNEALHRGDISEKELIIYINRVKEALSDTSVKVGCADTYYQYQINKNLVKACDIILVNCYPFWEGSAVDDALVNLRQMYALTELIADGKEIIITETGWPSEGQTVGNAKPSKLNAMKYFVQTQDWATKTNIPLFYFSSFDESWKVQQEGEVGARWGLWNKDEKLKY